MEIHVNIEFVDSLKDLTATINELKKLKSLDTKVFVTVQNLRTDLPAANIKLSEEDEQKIKDLLKTSGVEWEQAKQDNDYLAFCLAAANFLKEIKS